MPYISTADVSIIRETIKKQMPEAKFSVRSDGNYSGVDIVIRSGPFKFSGITYLNINQYHLDQEDLTNTELVFIKKILNIAESLLGNSYEDADYGTIPSYYINVSIGQWDRPYVHLIKK